MRHGIRSLDVSGEQNSADTTSAEAFVKTFSQLVIDQNLSSHQIYNADETGLSYRCFPPTTLASWCETSAVGFKQSKDRLTVLVRSNAAGHKVKLCVIGKFRKPRCFKNSTSSPVFYRLQSNTWMNCDIFLEGFRAVFVPNVKDNLKKNGHPEDGMVVLALDNCRAHIYLH